MKSKKIRFLLLPVFVLTAMIVTYQNQAREAVRIEVSLKINDQYMQFSGTGIKLDENIVGNVRLGKAPGDVLVSVENLPEPKLACRLKIDTDADSNLNNEA